MTSQVIPFPGVVIQPQPEPEPSQPIVNTRAIAILERALEQAKAGELLDIAVASISVEGYAGNGWSSFTRRSPLAGAISLLFHDYMVAMK